MQYLFKIILTVVNNELLCNLRTGMMKLYTYVDKACFLSNCVYNLWIWIGLQNGQKIGIQFSSCTCIAPSLGNKIILAGHCLPLKKSTQFYDYGGRNIESLPVISVSSWHHIICNLITIIQSHHLRAATIKT